MRLRALAPALVLALAPACNEGSPASPTFEASEAGVVVDATVSDAAEEVSYAVCPDGLDASFGSIYTLLLSNPSLAHGCGTDGGLNSCHSTAGASASTGTGNKLDLSLDAGAVYAELLGADGGGQRSTDVQYPTESILRVVPGDAGASMLYVKLTLDAGNVFPYGSGMPFNDPGSVCPATVAAVGAWINAGAPKN